MKNLEKWAIKKNVHKVPTISTSQLVKDLFIFSCFTGLSYVDIKKMKRSNIQSFFDGHQWIINRGKKSDVASNVLLMEIPKRIIEKYQGTTHNELSFRFRPMLPVITTLRKL
ncbi:MAG: hypothetical protein AB2L24_21565 [Mangrovibacterium sp.]